MARPTVSKPRLGRTSRLPRAAVEQFSRPPLARMMQLHQQLQARKFPTCRNLAREL
jgi:hypothetical protein